MINETDLGTRVQTPGSETLGDLLWEVSKVQGGGAGLESEEAAAAGEAEERAGPATESCINQFREFG